MQGPIVTAPNAAATRPSPTTGRRRWSRRSYLLAMGLTVVLCLVNWALQPGFFRLAVLAATATAFLPLMMIAVGQTYVVLGGSIDLSLGALVSLVNVIVVVLAERLGGSGLALASGLLAGALAGIAGGAVNGVLISMFRLEPIVVTFSTSVIYSGLALIVMPQAGGSLGVEFAEVYAGDLLGVPVVFIVVAGLVVATRRVAASRFYAHLMALGSQPQAAYQTGLPIVRLRVMSHALGGLMAAGAAFCILGVAAAGDPLMGQAFTLGSVSAVVLGGTALSGGWGSVVGTLFGAAILTLINNVIFFAQFEYVYQSIAQGVIVLLALAAGVVVSRRPG